MATTMSWQEADEYFPLASVYWDIQGGPQWLGDKSGPRLYLHSHGIQCSIGNYNNGTWDTAFYDAKREVWRFGSMAALSEIWDPT